MLTTQTGAATTPLDYILQDWARAGLHRPSAFRAYFGMAMLAAVQVSGQLSARDWQGVHACLARALAFPAPSGPTTPAPGA